MASSKSDNTVNMDIITSEMDPENPKIYFNGFTVHCRLSDVLILLKREEDNFVGTLYMSNTTAKTLSESLKVVLNRLEAQIGQKIPVLPPSQ